MRLVEQQINGLMISLAEIPDKSDLIQNEICFVRIYLNNLIVVITGH